jgi:hypothetical protein
MGGKYYCATRQCNENKATAHDQERGLLHDNASAKCLVLGSRAEVWLVHAKTDTAQRHLRHS